MATQKTSTYTKKLSTTKLHYIQNYLHGQDILDVGAGNCYYSRWLVEKNPHARVVSLDHMQVTDHDGFQFMQCDLEQPITVESEKFGTVLAFDIIEHITNEKQFVAELYRVCKPDGVLIGSVPHDDDGFLPAYNLTFKHRKDLTHKRYYIPTTLRQSLEQAGFEIVHIQKHGGISHQLIAEFFPALMRPVVRGACGVLRRCGIITTQSLASDLFFVAKKCR